VTGLATDKASKRRFVGRMPTRRSPGDEVGPNPASKFATWIGGLSVFGILFCLLMEVIDVRSNLKVMSFEISADFGLLGLFALIFFNFVYGTIKWCRAFFRPSTKRNLARQSLIIRPTVWPASDRQYDEPI
jgi:hypothetical protein